MRRLETALRLRCGQAQPNEDADYVFGPDYHVPEYMPIHPDILLKLAAWDDILHDGTWNEMLYEFGCKTAYLMQVWAVLVEMFSDESHVMHVDTVLRRVQQWRSQAVNNEYKALY